MKNLKYILLFTLGIVFFNSCDEDNSPVYDIKGGDNLAVFELSKQIVTRIADGTEYPVDVKMKVTGPSLTAVSGDITVTVEADPSSTAIAGVHYRIDEPTFTLKADQNYLGYFTGVTMLTKDIATPLEKSPVLVLKVKETSGNSTVIASGKTFPITLNYACPSDLAGEYTVTVLRDGAPMTKYTSVTITMTDVGTYRTSEVGHWTAADLGGTPGFTFNDVCGVLTVPKQNLVDLYSNGVQGFKEGSVDEATGILHIVYKVWGDAWESEYDCTYVPVK